MQLLDFANNSFTQECVETWGKSLEALTWQEKVYFLDWATLYLGNADLELSTEAEEYAVKLEESEECDVLQACASLSNTIHNFRGQELNDRAWVLHCGFKKAVESLLIRGSTGFGSTGSTGQVLQPGKQLKEKI